jgi:hypothetical protein
VLQRKRSAAPRQAFGDVTPPRPRQKRALQKGVTQ